MRRTRGNLNSVVTAFSLTLEADAPTDTLPATARWAGPIGMEDELTGDGRAIQGGALRWDTGNGAVPIRYVRSDVGFHDGAEVAGTILSIERRDGGVIWAEGDFDMTSEAGQAAYKAVLNERQNGVSMDLDDVSFEIRVAAELFAEVDAIMNGEGDAEAPVPNEDGTVTVATIHSDDEVMFTTDARVRAATIVAVPAFAEARIGIIDAPTDSSEPDEDGTPPGSDELAHEGRLTAAAAPLMPPARWFDNPGLPGPTPLTVTREGHVFGHLAVWGTCHISHTAGGKCVSAPNSVSGYAWFHTGALETDTGDILAVGHLTMSTGHAADDLTPTGTLSHYDNTGTVAADVRAGEDAHGIWVSGAMRPSITGEALRAFRAAPLSGDWRRVGGNLELVAALAVNVPGFGITRPSGHVKGDHLISLMASGMLPPADIDTTASAPGILWLPEDLAYLRTLRTRERTNEQAALAARRNRIKVAAFAARRKG